MVTGGMVAFIVLVLVLLSRAYPGSGADLVDWKPTRDYETELTLEQDDISQMLAAQNAYRRKRGASELTERDATRMANEDNRVRSTAVPLDQESMQRVERELGTDAGTAEAQEGPREGLSSVDPTHRREAESAAEQEPAADPVVARSREGDPGERSDPG